MLLEKHVILISSKISRAWIYLFCETKETKHNLKREKRKLFKGKENEKIKGKESFSFCLGK